MKWKTKLIAMTTIAIMAGLTCQSASAYSFSGNTVYGYRNVSSQYTKNDNFQYARVDWTYSNKSSHKQWFMSYNVTFGSKSAEGLLNYLATGASGKIYGPNMSSGQTYQLHSRREHIINPETYVSGNYVP